MMRLIEAMISSIEGSDGDFRSGMEAPMSKFRPNLGKALGICQREPLATGSLVKPAAEADPLILHLLVVPLHVVELHRQV